MAMTRPRSSGGLGSARASLVRTTALLGPSAAQGLRASLAGAREGCAKSHACGASNAVRGIARVLESVALDRAMDGSNDSVLHALLLSLFTSADEFRQWVSLGPDGPELGAELPGGLTSKSAAIFAALDVLRNRGHVDAEFFARLAAKFPRRRDEITRVASTWVARSRSRASSAEPAPGDPPRLRPFPGPSGHVFPANQERVELDVVGAREGTGSASPSTPTTTRRVCTPATRRGSARWSSGCEAAARWTARPRWRSARRWPPCSSGAPARRPITTCSACSSTSPRTPACASVPCEGPCAAACTSPTPSCARCRGRCSPRRGAGEQNNRCPADMALVVGTGPDGFVDGETGRMHEVKDVCLDVTEVTVAAFASCAAKGSCEPASTKIKFDDELESESPYCNADRADRQNYPVNCVDLTQAKAYCKAAGKRLPTEWEWEWAARGREEGRTYPWGEQAPSCERVVMDDGGDGCGKDRTWPVGSKRRGNSRDGLWPMSGNVFEWTSSSYSEKYAVVRGGSWFFNRLVWLRAAFRFNVAPVARFINLGFRCARTASKVCAFCAHLPLLTCQATRRRTDVVSPPRTGWSLRCVTDAESIAEHSLGVALVASMLVDDLRARVVVDGERVIRMALLHGAAEAFTEESHCFHLPSLLRILSACPFRRVAWSECAPLPVMPWRTQGTSGDRSAPSRRISVGRQAADLDPAVAACTVFRARTRSPAAGRIWSELGSISGPGGSKCRIRVNQAR